MTKLRIILILHVLFFLGWGAYLLTGFKNAEAIWLETRPVDPRDMLSGYYVALRYPIDSIWNIPSCKDVKSSFYVRLVKSDRTVQTQEGPQTLWTVDRCETDPSQLSPNEQWMQATKFMDSFGNQVHYGIETFYVSEKSPLRNARSGEVVAKIAINERHEGRILNLLFIKK